MTKWWYQIDPIFWLTKSCTIQDKFEKWIKEFSTAIIILRKRRLDTLEEEIELMDCEEDSLKNTKLSVIDRFILSKELNEEELLKETFTIFTSVSNIICYFLKYST